MQWGSLWSDITDQTPVWPWTLPVLGLCAQDLFLKIPQFYHLALHSSAHRTLLTFTQTSPITFILHTRLCWSVLSLAPLIHIREKNALACWGHIHVGLHSPTVDATESGITHQRSTPLGQISTAERHGEAAHCRAGLTWQSYRLRAMLCCAIQVQ